MNDHLTKDWETISQSYSLSTSLSQVKPVSSGLINDTFLVDNNGKHLVLQRINTKIFTKPEAIQANFDQVAEHLSYQEFPYSLLSAVKTLNGQSTLNTDDNVWRLMPFIEDSITINAIESEEQAFSAAKMVGSFDKQLGTLNPEEFFMTIPGFRDLDGRLIALKKVLNADIHDRKRHCYSVLKTVENFSHLSQWQSSHLANGNLKIKVTHNDTKITNQLFDNQTRMAKALIDWDTIMPGCWLFDYADMIRSFVPSANEESKKGLSQTLQPEVFQATTQGYLDATGGILTEFERDHLLTAVQIIFFMLGVRFLTDYLDGDNYFKIESNDQNLNRCKNQFTLLEQIAGDITYWQKLTK